MGYDPFISLIDPSAAITQVTIDDESGDVGITVDEIYYGTIREPPTIPRIAGLLAGLLVLRRGRCARSLRTASVLMDPDTGSLSSSRG